jgi:precorrin-3B C17-methyltransferase
MAVLGTVYVVGIGPGDREHLTLEAESVLKKSEVIVGYTLYVDLIRRYFPDKVWITSGMMQEETRCRMALMEAAKGKIVSMISSGDSGVYGMAGLMLCLGTEYPEVAIEIIPGITSALSGGAMLGAPLGHDFAVISLSDLLTPWERIEKRLRLAGEADLAIAIYNPSSRKRKEYLKRACDILLLSKAPETICGIVRNIAREGAESRILTLKELRDTEVDMLTTVFIGNSETRIIDGRMVTPRGYPL